MTVLFPEWQDFTPQRWSACVTRVKTFADVYLLIAPALTWGNRISQ